MGIDKKKLGLAVMLSFITVCVAYAFAVAPPQAQTDGCEDHDHEQPAGSAASVLTGEINKIDQTTAKLILVQLEEAATTVDCANQIAGALAKLGSIGQIKCDTQKRQFEVQYDPNTVNESHILSAFAEAEHPAKIISNS